MAPPPTAPTSQEPKLYSLRKGQVGRLREAVAAAAAASPVQHRWAGGDVLGGLWNGEGKHAEERSGGQVLVGAGGRSGEVGWVGDVRMSATGWQAACERQA